MCRDCFLQHVHAKPWPYLAGEPGPMPGLDAALLAGHAGARQRRRRHGGGHVFATA